MVKTTWSRIGLTALTVGAVTAGGVALTLSSSPPASAAEGLEGFDDCRELRNWYAEAALPQVTAWGLGGGERMTMGLPGAPSAAAEGDGSGEASARTGEAVGNGSTGTNVQEAGVDEPDVAKTDGRHVVVVRDNTLRVFDTAGESPSQVGELTVPEAHFEELLLVGQQAVLLGQAIGPASGGASHPGLAEPEPAEPGTAGPEQPRSDLPRPGLPQPTSPEAVISTVDLSNPAAPSLVNQEQVDGTVVSAREYDGTVRAVMSATPDLPFVTPDDSLSESQALARNRAVVRDATAEDWLPSRNRQALLDCSDVHHPERPSGLGTLSVLTFSPESPRAVDAVGVAADGDMVYSSADRLYVATMDGGWSAPATGRDIAAEELRTNVHSFALNGEHTAYSASGSVAGVVHNRWAFSEHEGRLRVATILGDPMRPTENAVTVLEEHGRDLQVVGSVAGMGVTEQIRAVRWFGDLAVVVTFRQTDPLYTVDLSDPTSPRVRGELKIPGFSAYLHPLGDGQLLGVGQDATLDGQQTGAQVSTFDLTSLDQPQQADTLDLGQRTYSAVQDDSRAFTYLPQRRVALVPVSGLEQAVHAVKVTEDGTMREVARFDLLGLFPDQVRTLPLDDGRIALADSSGVRQIVTL